MRTHSPALSCTTEARPCAAEGSPSRPPPSPPPSAPRLHPGLHFTLMSVEEVGRFTNRSGFRTARGVTHGVAVGTGSIEDPPERSSMKVVSF